MTLSMGAWYAVDGIYRQQCLTLVGRIGTEVQFPRRNPSAERSEHVRTPDIWIRIGPDERHIDAADAQWVHQSLRHHRGTGSPPCVQVRIRTDDANLRLSTYACTGGGASRPLTTNERRILSLWQHFGLSDEDADLAKVWAFLQRLRSHCGLRAA